MDIHKNGVGLPNTTTKEALATATAASKPAIVGLRSSWLIEGSTDTPAVVQANGGPLKTDQKRSALEDGLRHRTTTAAAAGKGDNVNDSSSTDDHCAQSADGNSTHPKNWSADDDKHDAKSDTCLLTTAASTAATRSHLGQV